MAQPVVQPVISLYAWYELLVVGLHESNMLNSNRKMSVYTVQPVVKPEPVWQLAASCIQTFSCWTDQLYNRLYYENVVLWGPQTSWVVTGNACTQASLDEPTQSVVMHRTEPSRLQSLALQLAEKMASLVDQNERTLEVKTSGLGYFNYQRPGSSHSVFCWLDRY